MTKIKGLDLSGKERQDAALTLQDAMAVIDRETDILHITGDVPTNDEREALGQHFTKVRFLKVATGLNEDWIDAKFPLNWPLDLLIIADAAGERITTPAILEGRINHLTFLYAHGLRFEGPLTKDLMKDAKPMRTIPAGQLQFPFDVEVYSAPAEWSKRLGKKYELESGEREEEDDEHEKEGDEDEEEGDEENAEDTLFSLERVDDPPSCIKYLDILGNDVLEMLTYMALAKFHLLASLESLIIYSSNTDLPIVPYFFLEFLGNLVHLKHVKLTLESEVYAKIFESTRPYPFIHLIHPPSIETLWLRGPVSAASEMDEFAADLANPTFLPNLKLLSLVLDLPDASSEHPQQASPEQLREARVACKKVLDVAAARGIAVEPFEEPWAVIYPTLFIDIDTRWSGA
ncbi:predicted protein [Chaetomium globosum CBS 148.51]|uniref:Uncharacterized protein n=1 Tax=Chaetomium globosum (strain ATCC 6205 / CBS 148.51 / DSM 1962 / NBRC 6347 / NRRL 1970) TaxID=306901 RepID=Q2GYR4_CHAGB|nr:uncharacterized protein CHGG_06890 [Chaetomium globosum CBS 148.51]EAQ85637.1 predicted protein [Chaetomium globosum CBS 148.51]